MNARHDWCFKSALPEGETSRIMVDPGVSARGRNRPESVTAQRLRREPVFEAENQTSFASGDQASDSMSNQSVESARAAPDRSMRTTEPRVSSAIGWSTNATWSPRGETRTPSIRFEDL